MNKRTVFLTPPQCYSYFRQSPFADTIADVRCLSGIQRSESPSGGRHFLMSIYYSGGQPDLEVVFDDERAAVAARQDLVAQMVKWFGPDQVVFSRGFYADVAVVPAIQLLTPICTKDGRAAFSAILYNAPVALHFVFSEHAAALESFDVLFAKVEAYHRSLPMSA